MRLQRLQRFLGVTLVSVLVATGAGPVSAQEAAFGGDDLSLSMKGPASTPLRGESFVVAIRVSNLGGDAADDVSVSTYVPEGLALQGTTISDPSMTCATSEYGTFDCQMPVLGPGSSVDFELSLTRTMARENWMDSWVGTSSGDVTPDDNYRSIEIAPDRSQSADVALSMSAPEGSEVGETFAYSIVVTNKGPETATDVTFNQSLSELVDFVSATSDDPTDECLPHEETYKGDSYVYREVRCAVGSLESGSSAHITVSVTRNDPHGLWSSGWVGSSSYDANYENDYADASIGGHPSVSSDLVLSIARTEDLPVVGEDFDLTLTLGNDGPAAAPDTAIWTWLPQELALRSLAPGDGTDTCEIDDYRGINCTVGTLAAREVATVTISVTRVMARETYFGASAYTSNSDPIWENNYAEDFIEADRSVMADVAVALAPPPSAEVGSDLTYEATVTNNGPMSAGGVTLVDGLPEGVEFVSAGSSDVSDTCVLYEEDYGTPEAGAEGEPTSDSAPYRYSEVRCDLGTMVAGEQATITIKVTRMSEYELWNSVWIGSSTYDENYGNDYGSVSTSGKRYDECFERPVSSDEDVVVDCAYAGGTKDDSLDYEVTSGADDPVVRLGRGNDSIRLEVPTSSLKHRTITVRGGRGSDSISVFLAPGAGNVTLVLRGGRGRDSISVEAPRLGDNVVFKMRGGLNSDTCQKQLGTRYRQTTC